MYVWKLRIDLSKSKTAIVKQNPKNDVFLHNIWIYPQISSKYKILFGHKK